MRRRRDIIPGCHFGGIIVSVGITVFASSDCIEARTAASHCVVQIRFAFTWRRAGVYNSETILGWGLDCGEEMIRSVTAKFEKSHFRN